MKKAKSGEPLPAVPEWKKAGFWYEYLDEPCTNPKKLAQGIRFVRRFRRKQLSKT